MLTGDNFWEVTRADGVSQLGAEVSIRGVGVWKLALIAINQKSHGFNELVTLGSPVEIGVNGFVLVLVEQLGEALLVMRHAFAQLLRNVLPVSFFTNGRNCDNIGKQVQG